ncbi:Hypothetical predicted protein [Olea europaea subsp. europaea]|uniref:Uncharacterized protein n=1 Tax=Olea europaea subsp. europaea TaxID=158383 RepID=A0A8S0TRT9_OLEEU|nr:Hypothetical predicted protein [Olea europaea subsp. europaea]
MWVAAVDRCGCGLLKGFGYLKLSAVLPTIISSGWWLDLCVLVLISGTNLQQRLLLGLYCGRLPGYRFREYGCGGKDGEEAVCESDLLLDTEA